MDIYGKDSGRDWSIFNEVNRLRDYRSKSITGPTALILRRDEEINICDNNDSSSSNENDSSEIALVDLEDRSNIVDDKAKLIPRKN